MSDVTADGMILPYHVKIVTQIEYGDRNILISRHEWMLLPPLADTAIRIGNLRLRVLDLDYLIPEHHWVALVVWPEDEWTGNLYRFIGECRLTGWDVVESKS